MNSYSVSVMLTRIHSMHVSTPSYCPLSLTVGTFINDVKITCYCSYIAVIAIRFGLFFFALDIGQTACYGPDTGVKYVCVHMCALLDFPGVHVCTYVV